ncbi:MAG: N-acetylmuramoyl-L-alanine amidase [Salinivirgaceae bacterium]
MRTKTNEFLSFSGTIKRKILLVVLLTAGIPYFQGNGSEPATKKKIVVLDAGHGGQDTGALGKKSKEKDIVLAITLKVGSYIEKNIPQVEVIYTRKTDVFIPLHERAMIANKNNADIFVSIHANSNPSSKPSGTETFAMGLHKTQGNLEVAKKENAVIVYEEDYNVKYEGFDPKSAESYIIFSLMQNTYLDQSLLLASYVQDEFREKAQRKDRGVKQAGFLVLWNTSMPSILVETGFISHESEEIYLMSDVGQEYLASAIYRAIKRYILELEADEKAMDAIASPKKTETKTNSEVEFRVQITSSSKQLSIEHPVFVGYSNIFEYFENGLYKYAVGKFSDYESVKKYQQELKQSFPGAFIVAFQNNQKVDLKKITAN